MIRFPIAGFCGEQRESHINESKTNPYALPPQGNENLRLILNEVFVQDTSAHHWLGVVSLITIVWAVAMTLETKLFEKGNQSVLDRFESPIVALELADKPARVLALIYLGDRRRNTCVMSMNIYMDFAFIALYTSVFWLFAEVCKTESKLPTYIKIGIILVALLDITENALMLRSLHDINLSSERRIRITRRIALTKWTLLAVASLLLAMFICGIASRNLAHSLPLKFIAGFLGVSAAMTLLGVFVNRWITFGIMPLFCALLCTTWIFS